MGSDEVSQELATGDIVFAKVAADPSGTEEWTEVALVICPEDVNVAHVRGPVVFTADGSLGELWPTVRAYADNDLAIFPGQATGNPTLLARVRDAVVSVQAIATDPAGAAVLDEFRRDQPTPATVVDPHLGFQQLVDVAGPGGFERATGPRRCSLCHRRLPCVHSS